ncbi:MAG: hypothetical protein KAR81_01065 [Sulfurimonas sp.]|nr:hypothetical protein [Sulfurimonas sp.]
MKQYIMIILIAMHLISSNLYATNSYVQEHKHSSPFYEYKSVHKHSHVHDRSNHSHKHGHTQTNINLLDFFLQSNDTKECMILCSKEKYTETKYYISNPSLKSIFRPPIV